MRQRTNLANDWGKQSTAWGSRILPQVLGQTNTTTQAGGDSLSSKEDCPVYSFWNGKNLKGGNQYFDYRGSGEGCSQCEFKCVEGTETVCADEL
ncbi:hypothetical protein [Sporomusa malonica]|uniref:hypothetical protein n=1 Tax=Sporomusa malonica TaxID=112901 RepID=UPI00111C87AB|nr:hypothetical protein [Sporomusa malonica]